MHAQDAFSWTNEPLKEADHRRLAGMPRAKPHDFFRILSTTSKFYMCRVILL